MSNKKVYVAKSSLATGLDVEYVKSNLSRIDGIEIIECGMGICPSECVAFVVIPGPNELVGYICDINKTISKALESFLEGDYGYESDVYIYCGKGDGDPGDGETTTPIAYIVEEFENGINEDFNTYSNVETSTEEFSMLFWIAEAIGSDDSWRRTPRHYRPAPEYALPPPPSLEDRRLGKVTSKQETKSSVPLNVQRRLLLRSRR